MVARQAWPSRSSLTVATGTSPSGPFHIGHLREVVTGWAITRAIRESGREARLIFVIDSMDPLRKLPPGTPEGFEEHLGRPLYAVPSPEGIGSWAQRFAEPFLEVVNELGIELEPVWDHELYLSGRYAPYVRRALEERGRIAEIISRKTGRALPRDWYPVFARCSACGRLTKNILGWKGDRVRYRCECGHEGEASISEGEVKLLWRVEWPARWSLLGVDLEPFGKDHAAAGGSYDTGRDIALQVYGREPPYPVPYEWIELKGRGPLSSSVGVVVEPADLVKASSPEITNFMILRVHYSRHISFDPATDIPKLHDDFDEAEERYFSGERDDLARAYELSLTPSSPRGRVQRVPFRHLVLVVQLSRDFEDLVRRLLRSGHLREPLSEGDLRELRRRVDAVRFWLERFGPEDARVRVLEEPPRLELEPGELSFIECLLEELQRVEWRAEEIQSAIFRCSRSSGLGPRRAFPVLYRIIFGRDHGPRAGPLLEELGRDFIVLRLRTYAKGS